jgi:hypothetical protein
MAIDSPLFSDIRNKFMDVGEEMYIPSSQQVTLLRSAPPCARKHTSFSRKLSKISLTHSGNPSAYSKALAIPFLVKKNKGNASVLKARNSA